jgi:hypothetical protein
VQVPFHQPGKGAALAQRLEEKRTEFRSNLKPRDDDWSAPMTFICA